MKCYVTMMQALNFNCVWWVSIFPTMHTWLLNNNQQKNKLFFGTNLIILVKTGKFLYRTFWSQNDANCWTRKKKRKKTHLFHMNNSLKCRLLIYFYPRLWEMINEIHQLNPQSIFSDFFFKTSITFKSHTFQICKWGMALTHLLVILTSPLVSKINRLSLRRFLNHNFFTHL